jgi:predicted PurR-regulated permease PerM
MMEHAVKFAKAFAAFFFGFIGVGLIAAILSYVCASTAQWLQDGGYPGWVQVSGYFSPLLISLSAFGAYMHTRS